jgi:beta-N-acetylhexosaminidase
MRLGLAAGNDLLMLCHRVELAPNVIAAIEEAPSEQLDRAWDNVARFRSKFAPAEAFDEAEFSRLNQAIWDLRVEVLGEEAAANRSVEDGKRSPVETY